ncbi:MAG: sulfatase-like hydrolase/transferase [Chloroflexota bacterium]
MRKVKNILFVLVDQLRWDYLSCYGHPHLHTPNIDWLAENGVRFERAYAQSPVCGPSRACISSGRYMSSQGAMSNTDPISASEKLMGEYLRPLGLRTAVIGKTDHRPDAQFFERFQIDPDSHVGKAIKHRDFDPVDLDNGLHPDPLFKPGLKYNAYLNAQGYEGKNPWMTWAQTVVDDNGDLRDGRIWSNSKYPSRLPDEHGESAYVTNQAIKFMQAQGDEPWCLQLGYYKPHWPYVANAPYHEMFPPETHLPINRTEAEFAGHPCLEVYHNLRLSKVFSKPGAREIIVTAYMGLVKQMDDHFGRLLTHMRKTGLLENTLIVFTSDHGDNLGDHWSGEKDLPYDCASKVPLIVYDPSTAADSTRGTAETRFAEHIDILPTFIEMVGGDPAEHRHRLEGRSLLPILHAEPTLEWRSHIISEFDFNLRDMATILGTDYLQSRAYMIRDERWKYVLWEGYPPMLFDMVNDPQEQHDLGRSPDHAQIRTRCHEGIFTWLRNLKHRTTVTPKEASWRYGRDFEDRMGILIGWWDDDDDK